ncbi:hypothetical protein [Acinetobacter baumannii]|uniref:Uncharacterized protein n=4 Tax=Acinetobacter baumannii TaxID=470 RepID=X2FEJ4_ACIBA|nr:hypothetical protein [Acinetobacter baumannii]ADX94363.1 hypothetical protein ABTW07_2p070 [Acinetobacter baumannii TCDC-AB0715]AHX67320.1 hypothetical protein B856_18975 [Acinetobacter baumannii AC30]AHM95327.1 hypothetical protein [Acinetobacter baumannii]AKB09316.1 hypothetical protein BL01_p0080 [Acinetobacter baumannii]AOX71719.1 hypothetical protein KAB01_03880 [Acinetobacter baumannii]
MNKSKFSYAVDFNNEIVGTLSAKEYFSIVKKAYTDLVFLKKHVWPLVMHFLNAFSKCLELLPAFFIMGILCCSIMIPFDDIQKIVGALQSASNHERYAYLGQLAEITFQILFFVAAIDTLRFLTTSDGNNYVRSYFGLEALKVLNISENIIDRSQDTLAQIVIRPNKKI